MSLSAREANEMTLARQPRRLDTDNESGMNGQSFHGRVPGNWQQDGFSDGWDGSAQGARGEESVAKFLGWFSIGLGLTQFLAPRDFARSIGVHDGDENVVRFVGMREIVAGVAILTQPRP